MIDYNYVWTASGGELRSSSACCCCAPAQNNYCILIAIYHNHNYTSVDSGRRAALQNRISILVL